MKTLIGFFIAIAIVLGILLCVTYFIKDSAHFKLISTFVAGYAVGMFTMYLKMRLILGKQ
jgi:lipid-A-disaccharide synthase-like uncharacterized protein